MNVYEVQNLVAGCAMILAGPVVLASYFLWPTMTSDGAAFVEETVSLGRGRVTASLVVGALGIPFAVIAVVGLIRLLEQKSLIGTVGGGLAIVGLTLFAGFVGAGAALIERSSSPRGSCCLRAACSRQGWYRSRPRCCSAPSPWATWRDGPSARPRS